MKPPMCAAYATPPCLVPPPSMPEIAPDAPRLGIRSSLGSLLKATVEKTCASEATTQTR